MEPARIDGKDAELEAALGYTFRRRDLLVRALTHSSLAYEQATAQPPATQAKARTQPKNNAKNNAKPPARTPKKSRPQVEDNEQLEFLGDAVLGLIVAEALYRAHPEMTEGQLTRLRSALVSRKHMAQVAHRLELGRYLRMGRGEERSGGRKKAALLANAAEALLAAVYLDAATPGTPHDGLEATRRIIQTHVIDPSLPALLVEAAAGPNIGDYKSTLQEFLQSEHRGQPEYIVTGQTGPDHRKRFLVEVRIPGVGDARLARGIGNTKKHAEQEAARRALLKLRTKPARPAPATTGDAA
ncbi:MAG: ribonuclease III [Acidobacteriaceae bacterium]